MSVFQPIEVSASHSPGAALQRGLNAAASESAATMRFPQKTIATEVAVTVY